MSRKEWFRNADWNESIERAFEEKLRRSRRKSQYLRIQASILSESHPETALRLLDEYFALGDQFAWAQAYCDQACAFISLGRVDDAIAAYQKALEREAEFANVKTQAYIELPFLIVTRGLREKFDHAARVLQEHESRLMFPLDRFMWHCARALIAQSRGDGAGASEHASRALIEASRRNSGFLGHPTVGSVTQQYQSQIDELTLITGKPLH